MAKHECFLPMGKLFFCCFFILLSVFCPIAIGNGEGQSKKFYPEIDEPREYVIQIAIKFSGGGEIIMNRDYQIGQTQYSQGQVLNIEDLLAQLYGITVAKYVPNKENSANVDLETRLKNAAKLEFEKTIHKIRVSEESKDGGVDKAKAGKGKEIEFPIAKGQVPIHFLVDKLAKVDWRWHTKGKLAESKRHVFQSHYSGHAMVTLSERVVDTEHNGIEKLEEVARFHYNMLGLNLYKKRVRDERTGKYGVNVIVADDETMTEGHKEFEEANRGLYTKSEFAKGVHLLTRKMTIREIEKIALKVIGGREWGGAFMCPHFIYNFVRSIIPEKSLQALKTLEHWPESMRVLDDGYKLTIGSFAFDESLEMLSENLLVTPSDGGKQSGGESPGKHFQEGENAADIHHDHVDSSNSNTHGRIHRRGLH